MLLLFKTEMYLNINIILSEIDTKHWVFFADHANGRNH